LIESISFVFFYRRAINSTSLTVSRLNLLILRFLLSKYLLGVKYISRHG
uniref:Glycosyltransferase family 2 protein n=1 Tax=Ascaris lumbricoides TaxID=6252 RepID=A0A0M3HMB7_ASCLU